MLAAVVPGDVRCPTLRFERRMDGFTSPVYTLALQDKLLVSEMDANRVKVVTLENEAHGELGAAGTFGQPTGMALSKGNIIYVGQQGARGIRQVEYSSGSVRAAAGRPEDGGEFVESAVCDHNACG